MSIDSTAPTARLVVGPGDPRVAARVGYAFSAYAALHGIRVVPAGPADVTVAYGESAEPADVVIPAGYQPRPAATPAPPPTWIDGLPCFHPAPGGAAGPAR